VLQRGRLAHLGGLDELRATGGVRAMEIVLTGAEAARLEASLAGVEGARVTATPGGARVEVPSESHVDEALRASRNAGATLVAVHPVGNPLEELFVSDKGTKQPT
jgi:hypothetical protein